MSPHSDIHGIHSLLIVTLLVCPFCSMQTEARGKLKVASPHWDIREGFPEEVALELGIAG